MSSETSDLDPEAPGYRVWCEHCELEEEYHESEPPAHVVNYWSSRERAIEQWSARSAARGSRDNHRASVFRDYENGLRHRPHIEPIYG